MNKETSVDEGFAGVLRPSAGMCSHECEAEVVSPHVEVKGVWGFRNRAGEYR